MLRDRSAQDCVTADLLVVGPSDPTSLLCKILTRVPAVRPRAIGGAASCRTGDRYRSPSARYRPRRNSGSGRQLRPACREASYLVGLRGLGHGSQPSATRELRHPRAFAPGRAEGAPTALSRRSPSLPPRTILFAAR